MPTLKLVEFSALLLDRRVSEPSVPVSDKPECSLWSDKVPSNRCSRLLTKRSLNRVEVPDGELLEYPDHDPAGVQEGELGELDRVVIARGELRDHQFVADLKDPLGTLEERIAVFRQAKILVDAVNLIRPALWKLKDLREFLDCRLDAPRIRVEWISVRVPLRSSTWVVANVRNRKGELKNDRGVGCGGHGVAVLGSPTTHAEVALQPRKNAHLHPDRSLPRRQRVRRIEKDLDRTVYRVNRGKVLPDGNLQLPLDSGLSGVALHSGEWRPFGARAS